MVLHEPHIGDTGAVVSVGEHEVTKIRHRRSSFASETTNLRQLSTAKFRHAPELLRVDERVLSFEMERVTPWSELDIERRTTLLPFVGQAIGRLHKLEPIEPDPMSLPDAIRARIDGAVRRLSEWRSRFRDHLLEELRSVDIEALLVDVERVSCHRDFRPQNWGIRETSNEVVFFDWEHGRPDFAAVDFARLHRDFGEPQVAAILRGYAEIREVPSVELRRLAVLMHILQTFAWAEHHDDDSYREEARRLSERRTLWASDP